MAARSSSPSADFVELPLRDLRALRAQLIKEIRDEELERTRHDAEAIRSRCRDKFSNFVKAAWHVLEPTNPLKWSWHLDAMCDHLQAITEGRLTPWLIINVPPGSSKSMIVSVLWQAWEWGPCGLPSNRFLTTSFELENVKRDTRKTRDLIESEWYRTLWPEIFDENGKLARSGEMSFANKHTGTREGVPFASITGKRGDRVVIDDPHSLDGAESEVERTKATRRFVEGGLNRLNDQMTSAIVVVMQRLHESDLTGVLLSLNIGFIHLMIPMEFEPERRCETPLIVDGLDERGQKVQKNWADPRSYDGELMDPVRMPREAVEKLKGVSDYSWAGQYQQRPAPREGGLFKVGMIEIVDRIPMGGKIVAGWDLAGSKGKKSPYSVRVKMKRVRGVVYVLDVKRRRTSPNELEEMVEDTLAEPDVYEDLPQDPGQAGKAQKMRFAELLAGKTFSITVESGDKQARAGPFASQVEVGAVKLARGAWNQPYKDELSTFPSGTYKDQVDASSRAFAAVLRLDRGEDDTPAAPIILEPAGIGDLSVA
jgi:predicted phage terminase large subunit-like protein